MEVILYAKGISWFDDCRIPFVDEGDKWTIDRDKEVIVSNPQHSGREDIKWKREGLDNSNNQGRFPANILVCDDMLNDGVISKSSLFPKTNTPIFDTKQGWNDNSISGSTGGGFNDKGTNSRYYDIDKWFEKLLDSCE
jgi:hypothetical protein